jgi:hypothetical protein
MRTPASRLQSPAHFKTAGVNVNIGARSNVMVLTEEQRHRLMDYNREWLLDPSTMTEDTPA